MTHRSPAWAAVDAAVASLRPPGSPQPAGAARRIAAYITDAVLIVIVWRLASDLVDGRDLPMGGLGAGLSPLVVAIISAALLSAAWFVVGWSGGRSTPGMFAWRIRVVDATSGGPIAVGAALRRWAVLEFPVYAMSVAVAVAAVAGYPDALLLDSVTSLVWPLVLLTTMARSPIGQGWHDRFAGTLVVRRTGLAVAAA